MLKFTRQSPDNESKQFVPFNRTVRISAQSADCPVILKGKWEGTRPVRMIHKERVFTAARIGNLLERIEKWRNENPTECRCLHCTLNDFLFVRLSHMQKHLEASGPDYYFQREEPF